jgi:chromosome segregation ATPase
MLEDFDALTDKLVELASRMSSLRAENQHLRARLADSDVELETLRRRIGGATERIDALLARLPLEAAVESETVDS